MTLEMFMNIYLVLPKLFKKKLQLSLLVHISLQRYQIIAKLGKLLWTKNWLWSMLKEMVRFYFLCGYNVMFKKSFSKENFRILNTV